MTSEQGKVVAVVGAWPPAHWIEASGEARDRWRPRPDDAKGEPCRPPIFRGTLVNLEQASPIKGRGMRPVVASLIEGCMPDVVAVARPFAVEAEGPLAIEAAVEALERGVRVFLLDPPTTVPQAEALAAAIDAGGAAMAVFDVGTQFADAFEVLGNGGLEDPVTASFEWGGSPEWASARLYRLIRAAERLERLLGVRETISVRTGALENIAQERWWLPSPLTVSYRVCVPISGDGAVFTATTALGSKLTAMTSSRQPGAIWIQPPRDRPRELDERPPSRRAALARQLEAFMSGEDGAGGVVSGGELVSMTERVAYALRSITVDRSP